MLFDVLNENATPFLSMLRDAEIDPWENFAKKDERLQAAQHKPVAIHHSQMSIKLFSRDNLVSTFLVTNLHGCRIYFGSNVHDFCPLLERDHLEKILQMCHHDQNELYGPESFEQIKV